MNLENLTDGELFVVEWQYRMLGGFGQALAMCISKADNNNLSKLEMGFPSETRAMKAYMHQDGWWETVQKKAGI